MWKRSNRKRVLAHDQWTLVRQKTLYPSKSNARCMHGAKSVPCTVHRHGANARPMYAICTVLCPYICTAPGTVPARCIFGPTKKNQPLPATPHPLQPPTPSCVYNIWGLPRNEKKKIKKQTP